MISDNLLIFLVVSEFVIWIRTYLGYNKQNHRINDKLRKKLIN